MSVDPLITLVQLKAASGDYGDPTADSPNDLKLQGAITAASDLVRDFTGMRFETASGSVSSERSFEYDGSGYLDIDECQTIVGITSQSGYTATSVYTLTADEWAAQPYNRPVKLWLRLSDVFYVRGISPEMGFTYNLDTLGYLFPAKPNIIKVTGVWGWPAIPAAVQQATLWTALSMADTARPYNQESIANYSRTRGGDFQSEAIPERAQVALLPYIIPHV